MADFDLDSAFIPALYKPSELLPIAEHKNAILYLVETYQVLIVIGETGSGKTTQIPQFLANAGWCSDGQMIGVTQPRRVAATTIATRVAEEFNCEVGQEVGYAIRFEDVTSESTKIKFLTDGLLIREALMDPLLSRYSVIMVDEAHERSISTDVLLGLLKKIKKRRPELRIVVSSATLQAEAFLNFFSDTKKPSSKQGEEKGNDDQNDVRIISIEGRTYPVDILYLEAPTEDYVDRAIRTVFDIHAKEPPGDILVFLTGRDEIQYALETVSTKLHEMGEQEQNVLALPLYAGLTTEQQQYIFDKTPEKTRKVVFATNIAEASVTISGVVYVVDCGFAKIRVYDPKTGIETLTAAPVSKASAVQRAGRAGRTQPGKCLRLYPEAAFGDLAETTPPEMQRSNLAPILLQLKALGIDNVLRFDFLSPPPSELMARGLELLYSLGALDEYAKLTRPLGLRMAELSAVEPMMARALLAAPELGCLAEMLTVAAMTSAGGGGSIFFHHEGERKRMEAARRKFAADEGDHLTYLNAYQAFVTKGRKEARFCHDNHLNYKTMTRAVSIRTQLKRYLERFGINDDEIGKVLPPSSTAPPTTTTAAASLRGGLVRRGKPTAAGDNDKAANGNNAQVAENVRRCLTTGYFAHAARMQPDGTFLSVDGGVVLHAHPSSLLFTRKADWVIFHEVLETAGKTFIRDVTKVEKGWLVEYAPEFYKVQDTRPAI